MTAVIIILIVTGVLAFGASLACALVAGASACDTPEEKARDDMEQEQAIRKWLEKKKETGAQK